jgi:hypothetical protein
VPLHRAVAWEAQEIFLQKFFENSASGLALAHAAAYAWTLPTQI